MSSHEIESTARELQELKRMREDIDAEITALEDQIKSHMGDQEQLTAGAFKISWKTVTSSRLDTAALKNALPEIAARFVRQTTTRRFSVC